MNYIQRKAEIYLQKDLSTTKVVIVLGARQVGKTTLVQHILKENAVFLNLDIEVDKNRLMSASSLAPKEALKNFGNPKFLVIDEAQRLTDAGRIVKGWHDAQLPVKIILLGSSSLNLLNQTAESLTGRNVKIFLPPLIFEEILGAQSWYSPEFTKSALYQNFSNQIQETLIQTIVFGSYPEAIASDDKKGYLLNLVSDYLLKDVLQIGLVKTPDLIKNLLMLLAHQVGSEVSVSELASNLKTTRVTVDRYLDLLEQTFVIFRLPAFSTNSRKEIAKNQKIYFWDTGVRNALINEFSLNPLRGDIGALWENWVIAEFGKQNALIGKRKNLYFWRARTGGEVDLVIKEGAKINAYEIKWSKKSVSRQSFSLKYGAPVQLIDSSNPLIQI
ncbi:MAG: AAA ATPase [Parcubacteria group bacterium GW2011_GWC2_44_17]|uniref:AAA+ ATPase domain-containing protein n=1 Tax=Candidatus Jacksonbacteria bacterium RIFCSPLOWO2_02_FULL_44_20 TaxID=1798460 RepID=A0A1G2A642_9BACT|nr:MAG: AAA ATPase [Parcubacteria group bacterium GW2011_GWC2_44_17]OGY72338.1 MAG: hypothetical protein A3H61_03090 [Candidatus Jacksonbacteria bacterium RIFCSPLOWO2_02_FULL_44_20]OGY73690.1 MAG: hypothetical protein A3H07_04630 [Candidatus Jacksonbacteria bacterium RIFCSPLOWO2_12_FULL_44_15b]HCA67432.1 hypothetical protein [Candidatus Jacksonbacteria bacterium]HCE86594.1 hypothetical protein [Candidatus Jacksonbacteria bacterium]